MNLLGKYWDKIFILTFTLIIVWTTWDFYKGNNEKMIGKVWVSKCVEKGYYSVWITNNEEILISKTCEWGPVNYVGIKENNITTVILSWK